MHKGSSHCWVVCHLLMVLWNYCLHCHPSSSCQFSKLISCNRDLRQSSDFSLQYVIYMSLLTQQGIFFLFALLRSSMYQMLQVWLKHTLSWIVDLKTNSHISMLKCAAAEAAFDVGVVRTYQKHSCVLETVQKHYTRGDLKFLMWCDRPSHWTLWKGVNLPLETHSFSGVWQ